MQKRKPNQRQRILIDLLNGKQITQKDAVDRYSCFRLSARIYELRQEGWPIQTDMEGGYGTYYIPLRFRQEVAA